MFKQSEKNQKIKNKRLRILGLVLGFFAFIFNAICLFIFYFKSKNWHKFIKGQKKEINELSCGQEDFGQFCNDSSKLLKDLFIPSTSNDNKPLALRPKSLISYALLAILVKLAVTGFLFFTYPSPAQLAVIVSSNMISLVNESREEAGLEPLTENALLDQFAQAKGEDMINRDYFAHDTPEGKRPWQWIDRAEYDYVYAGENLAMDFTEAETVHEAFMKSPSHRKNILNSKYKEVGMAVLHGEMGGHETILLVEFFGTQRADLSTLVSAKPAEAAVTEEEITPTPTGSTPTSDIAGEEVYVPSNRLPEAEVAGAGNEGIIVVATDNKNSNLVNLVIEYSNIFFIAFLIFLVVSLALNIFVKINVQHASVILQSVVVIALIIAMILVKFNFIEQIAPRLLIL